MEEVFSSGQSKHCFGSDRFSKFLWYTVTKKRDCTQEPREHGMVESSGELTFDDCYLIPTTHNPKRFTNNVIKMVSYT